MAANPAASSPVDEALAQLGALAAAGVSPERVVETVGGLVAGWAGEADMDADAARERVERLWDSLSKDAADLQEAVSDAGSDDARALSAAKRTLAALHAAVSALAAVHGRL